MTEWESEVQRCVQRKLRGTGARKGLNWFRHVKCMIGERLMKDCTSLRRNADGIKASFVQGGWRRRNRVQCKVTVH